jgi:hypothetical protein
MAMISPDGQSVQTTTQWDPRAGQFAGSPFMKAQPTFIDHNTYTPPASTPSSASTSPTPSTTQTSTMSSPMTTQSQPTPQASGGNGMYAAFSGQPLTGINLLRANALRGVAPVPGSAQAAGFAGGMADPQSSNPGYWQSSPQVSASELAAIQAPLVKDMMDARRLYGAQNQSTASTQGHLYNSGPNGETYLGNDGSPEAQQAVWNKWMQAQGKAPSQVPMSANMSAMGPSNRLNNAVAQQRSAFGQNQSQPNMAGLLQMLQLFGGGGPMGRGGSMGNLPPGQMLMQQLMQSRQMQPVMQGNPSGLGGPGSYPGGGGQYTGRQMQMTPQMMQQLMMQLQGGMGGNQPQFNGGYTPDTRLTNDNFQVSRGSGTPYSQLAAMMQQGGSGQMNPSMAFPGFSPEMRNGVGMPPNMAAFQGGGMNQFSNHPGYGAVIDPFGY